MQGMQSDAAIDQASMTERHSPTAAPVNANATPHVAVIIPMHNEEDAVVPLIEAIVTSMAPHGAFEIIAVDDGSTDKTLDNLKHCQSSNAELRILTHAQAAGQSAAVHSGVKAAHAQICVTLDGDGQNPPEELPKLCQPLLQESSEKIGLVAGQRVKRQDTFSKRTASKLANALRSRVLNDGTRDTGCGLKAFRRDAFLALPYFNHMHRYLPALFRAQGWEVELVDVSHRERATGQSKYTNLGRAIVGIWDLMGVYWLLRRTKTASPQEIHNA